jgi:cobaltochelatase CobN
VISASDAYFDLVSAPPQLVLEARRYFITGGEDNFKALARLLAKAVGLNVEVPPLREISWMGIYHPRLGTFTSLEEYLKVVLIIKGFGRQTEASPT